MNNSTNMSQLAASKAFALAAIAAAALSCAHAQAPKEPMTIHLRDGRVVVVTQAEMQDGSLKGTKQEAQGSVSVSFPVATVTSIDCPVPAEVARSRDLVTMGKAGQALIVLEPAFQRHASLRAIPGNRWEELALAKVETLSAAGQDKEAEQLLAELSAASKDEAVRRILKIKEASALARQGKHREAIAVYDEITKKESDREALGAAWLNKGQSLLAMGDYEQAALCFLRVPVFYSDNKNLVPPAMLGVARAMAGMGDRVEAENRFRQLAEQFPASPDGKTAKKELENLSGKTPPTTNENTNN